MSAMQPNCAHTSSAAVLVVRTRLAQPSLREVELLSLMELTRNPTRSVRIGTVTIGAGRPIAVQSMTATPTRDIDATVAHVNALADAGADVVRIAVDSAAESEAVAEIRRQTKANLVVDLQENYRLAE